MINLTEQITEKQWTEMQEGLNRSYGVCMTMGTASTMTGLADVLGMCLPGASSIPAPDSSHVRMCSASGRRIVGMVWEDLTPTTIMSHGAFLNAIKVAMAAWNTIYGTQAIARHKPYLATLRRGVWHVEGSFGRRDHFGGPPRAEIAKTDGRILRLSFDR